jgi:hypothetical protein
MHKPSLRRNSRVGIASIPGKQSQIDTMQTVRLHSLRWAVSALDHKQPPAEPTGSASDDSSWLHGWFPGHGIVGWRCRLESHPKRVAPKSQHILDWFHLAMRFQQVIQVTRGLSHDQIRTAKLWVTGRVDRAKWCLWNGKSVLPHFRCRLDRLAILKS